MMHSVKITNRKNSVQMASCVNGNETGFADIIIGKEEIYTDLLTSHYYILMVMSGEVIVSCKLYRDKFIKSCTMAFIPKGSNMVIRIYYNHYSYR